MVEESDNVVIVPTSSGNVAVNPGTISEGDNVVIVPTSSGNVAVNPGTISEGDNVVVIPTTSGDVAISGQSIAGIITEWSYEWSGIGNGLCYPYATLGKNQGNVIYSVLSGSELEGHLVLYGASLDTPSVLEELYHISNTSGSFVCPYSYSPSGLGSCDIDSMISYSRSNRKNMYILITETYQGAEISLSEYNSANNDPGSVGVGPDLLWEGKTFVPI